MRFDLSTRALRALWPDCGCWSPVPIDAKTLAVANDSGIWIVPIDAPQEKRLAFPAKDVLELIGTELTSNHSMLFLRSSGDPKCTFGLWEVGPDFSSAHPAKVDSGLACGSDFDFEQLTKPSQVLKGKTLLTLRYQGSYAVVVEADEGIKPLFQRDGSAPINRFDPVWINASSIAFVTAP
ncbi:MAG: hypothetical protein M3Y72_09585 [Acidobacteriota bacterium]|nr:hypothetical protein [Acidobacteriota bacterium]